MKLRFNGASALAGLAVGVLLAGGVAWASGSIQSSSEQVCRTKAGYLRISSTGECRRSEVPVELPQGPQGEQGIQGQPGVDGRDGSDANVESVRCFQRLTRGVDLHDCQIPLEDLDALVNLSGANLTNATFARFSPTPTLGASRGYGQCAFDTSEVKCWGGLGAASTPVPGDLDAAQVLDIQSGVQTSCALMNSGALRCWGDPGYGQNSTPADLGPIAQLAIGDVHTCVLTRAGAVRCWGIGRAGIASVPSGLGTVTQLVSGGDYACALNEAGSVTCWGWTPGAPAGLPRIVRLFAGYNNVCAIDESASPHCWGTDLSTIGDNFPTDLGRVKSISGGVASLCAVLESNALRCWGGFVGQLNGSRNGSEARVPLDLGPAKAVSAGVFHTCAVALDDRIRCWGNDQAASADFYFGSVQSSKLDLTGAKVDGLDLSRVQITTRSRLCNLVGVPKALPVGWFFKSGCLAVGQ